MGFEIMMDKDGFMCCVMTARCKNCGTEAVYLHDEDVETAKNIPCPKCGHADWDFLGVVETEENEEWED